MTVPSPVSGLPPTNIDILQRMVNAVHLVQQRLFRGACALNTPGIPYALAGSNAVAAWIATVDESAVRNTPGVEVLIRRGDLPAIRAALEAAGFVYRHVDGANYFLESVSPRVRTGIRLHVAFEAVRVGQSALNPDVAESTTVGEVRVLNLRPLVEVKLAAFQTNDRVDLRDLIGIGLIDTSWMATLPRVLQPRLQELLETPDG